MGRPMGMLWHKSHRADPRGVRIADRHYNRQKIGAPQFAPPGSCVVLLTEGADALWVTSWPLPQFVKHQWAGARISSTFRNESPYLSSELITQAVAATRWFYGDPPPLGIVTFVDAGKVRRKRDPGRCYLRAGWGYSRDSEGRPRKTKGGLWVLELLPEQMPEPEPPVSGQISFQEVGCG